MLTCIVGPTHPVSLVVQVWEVVGSNPSQVLPVINCKCPDNKAMQSDPKSGEAS